MAKKRQTKRKRGTVGTGAKKVATRKSPARSSARSRLTAKSIAKTRRPHKFVVHRFTPEGFKTDGLRTYAHYRDLGIRDATDGMVVAHVIRFSEPCDPKVVSKEHTHEAEFQMIYVLKGSITTAFEGEGTHTMRAGDAWLQPCNIRHKVLDYSQDCELLEIVMPADFKTVELEA